MRLTLEQAKALRTGDTVYCLYSCNRKGEPHKVRVNGAVRTWKRDANRVQVPWKHGLYGPHGYITEADLDNYTLEYSYAKENQHHVR
jgi:hypothetical protein